MPLYDYECGNCSIEFESQKTIEERKTATCPGCGATAKLFIKPGRAPGLSLFPEGWFRDITTKPLYIRTPQELRDACDKHNSRATVLENGPWKTSPGPDPQDFEDGPRAAICHSGD